jgi:prefoldin subunit 5
VPKMSDIDPKEFGALQADVRTLINEIHMLRQEMAQVNAVINKSKGAMYMLMSASGLVGSAFTIFVTKAFGL